MVSIELTLELTDGFLAKSMTDEAGFSRFHKVPKDSDGEILFTDVEQAFHHALAADLYGAIKSSNSELCINTLKNVMAFYEVEKAFQQIYRKKAKQSIIDTFPKNHEINELLYAAGCRKMPRSPDFTPYIGDTVVLRGAEQKTVLVGVGASKGLLTKEEMDAVIRNAKNKSEAYGIMGKEMAKKRAGHLTDPRYIDRYHGPDDMTEGPDGKLTEWEAKGWKSDKAMPATDTKDNKQGSAAKNKARAEIMTSDKVYMIGQASSRQGGPYTQDEIELWDDILFDRGNKEHRFVHVNTQTGKVKVWEQNLKGSLIGIDDEFDLSSNAIRALENAF